MAQRSRAEVASTLYRCVQCAEPATHWAQYRQVEQFTVRQGGIDTVVEQYRTCYLCTDHARATVVSNDPPRHLEMLAHTLDIETKTRRANARLDAELARKAQLDFEEWML